MFSLLGYIRLILWFGKKTCFLSFCLESKFFCQIIQTWILIIIFILFMIDLYNHVLLTRIHDIDTLACCEKLFFPPFCLEIKFIHQIRQTWILVVNFIFMIEHYNHVPLIGIHNTDALVWKQKLFFPSFCLELEFIHWIR